MAQAPDAPRPASSPTTGQVIEWLAAASGVAPMGTGPTGSVAPMSTPPPALPTPAPRLCRLARRAVLLVAVGLAVVATACAKPVPSRAELVGALETSGIAPSEATCAADAILKNLSKDQVALIVERGSSGAPADDPNRTDDPSDKVRAALAACRAAAVTTSTSITTPAPTTPTTTATGVTATDAPVFDTVTTTAAP